MPKHDCWESNVKVVEKGRMEPALSLSQISYLQLTFYKTVVSLLMNTTIYKIEWGTTTEQGSWRPESARYFFVDNEDELRRKLDLPARTGGYEHDPKTGKMFTIGGIRVENV